MLVVIDTNVLVSALWSKDGNPRKVLDLLLNGKIKPCFDSRILIEYRVVMSRPRFNFSAAEIYSLMSRIEETGISVVPAPVGAPFIDENDKKFFETAKQCSATLITGNIKHYPDDVNIMNPSDFLKTLQY